MGRLLIIVLASLAVLLLAGWLIGERGRLLRRSTRSIIAEDGFWHLLGLHGLHGYVYARWPNRYIGWLIHHGFRRLGPRGKRLLAETYHGKVLTVDHAKAIVTVNRPLPLVDLDQIIPYPTARNLILQSPLDIAVFECPCRAAREHPCEPTQVCMIVGQPFVDFVLAHHPRVSRRITKAEAVALLEAEHRRGHVHSAWFKNACLNRFFAICNCCACCCGGIDAMVNHGIAMMTSSGYVARCDPHACQGCGTCAALCPFDAVTVNGNATVDWQRCMGCGVCVDQCPQQAIQLTADRRKGIPLDVRVLRASARSCSAESQ